MLNTERRDRNAFAIILLIGATFTACIQNQAPGNTALDCRCGNEDSSTSALQCLCITKQIALLIARAKVSSNYDLNQLDADVSDKGDAWVVDFHLKPEFGEWTGGAASVKIDNETGEVTSFYFGK